MSENRKDLPATSAPNYNQRLRETIQTYLGKQGDPLDRGLTLRDLIANGIVKFKDGFNAGSLAGGGGGTLPIGPVGLDAKPDLTPPPQPSGFAVSAAISHVFIEHDPPIYPQGRGHLRTRVYGAIVKAGDPLPTFDKAVEVGQFSGAVWAMPSNPATTWRLWTKWESNDGVLSPTPAGGTNGLEAVTGQDVDAMVQAMTGAGKPFTVLNTPQVIGGVTFPSGIYSTNAFIMDAQVSRAKIANLAVDNAKIANLAVDDAKIASLSASKLTAGSIAVGRYIQSAGYVAGSAGWRINGNGTAEFSGVVVRGTVFANAGAIGGVLIGASSLRSANFAGRQAGWMIGSNGYAEFNNVSVRGAIHATSGFFSGTLAANIVKAENIISKSATSFEQTSISCTNGVWTAINFYMDHWGICTVIASGTWNQSGSGGSYKHEIALGDTGYFTGAVGNWRNSAAPSPQTLMLSRFFNKGWHRAYIYMSITTATATHRGYATILRSYR